MPRALLLSAALVSAVPACGGEEPPQPAAAGPGGVVQGLCEAADRAREGDLAAARRAWDDRSHQGLHALAAELQSTERGLATQLLRAKATVEAAFGNGTDGETLAAHLDGLRAIVETAAALRAQPVGGCA